jgi:hypothetical protein
MYAGAAAATPQQASAPKAQGTASLGLGSDGESAWPLAAGDWTAHYLADDGYSSLASVDFRVQ